MWRITSPSEINLQSCIIIKVTKLSLRTHKYPCPRRHLTKQRRQFTAQKLFLHNFYYCMKSHFKSCVYYPVLSSTVHLFHMPHLFLPRQYPKLNLYSPSVILFLIKSNCFFLQFLYLNGKKKKKAGLHSIFQL